MKTALKSKLNDLVNQEIDDYQLSKSLREIVYEDNQDEFSVKESVTFKEMAELEIEQQNTDVKEAHIYPTHFENLDEVIGGLAPGELIVLGGRPAMGKTQFLVNLALNIARNHGVLYFSFDLTPQTITKRFISCLTHIPISNMLQHDLSSEMKNKLNEAINQMDEFQLYLNDSCHQSVSSMKKMCEKHVKENNVKLIFVDYLQLMSSVRFKRNREMEISYISRQLKKIAHELNVCVFVSSQLSRSVESRGGDKRPILSDLRESGAIEQDADKVLFMYRPEYYGLTESEMGESNQNVVEIIVAKNRNGKLGEAKMTRDLNFTHFGNYHTLPKDFLFKASRLSELNAEGFDDVPF